MTLTERLACVGVMATGVRALDEGERLELARERRSLAWRAVLLALAAPCLFLAGLLAGGWTVTLLPTALKPLGLLPLVGTCVADAVVALRSLDAMRRRRRIAADLGRGEVACFEGHARAAVNERTRMLLAREGFPVDGALSVAFEVLAATGRLWAVGATRSRTWVLLPMQKPAAVPAHASVAANWVKPVASQGNATLLARTRLLSPDEQSEIGVLQRRALSRNARPAFVSLVALGFVLPSALHGGGSLRPAAIGLCAFIVVSLGRTLARDVRVARALGRDRANGFVHVVRTQAAADAEMSAPTEVLPLSRVAWTQAGEPTPWRRGSGAEIARG